jgi:dTDP-4-dehydrorhamnose 3,5-epimerase
LTALPDEPVKPQICDSPRAAGSNLSWNCERGTLRGMHFQLPPLQEPKLMRCTRVRIFDVAIDLRRDSLSFSRWVGIELSQDRRNALFILSRCAHSLLRLEANSEVFYMMG